MVDKNKLLQEALKRKRLVDTGCIITPYTNRDGSESWQQKVDKDIVNPIVHDMSVVASNAAGKTTFLAYLVLTILNGKHPLLMERFGKAKDIQVLFYSPSYPVQEDAIQAQLAECSDFECCLETMSERYKIFKNGSLIKSIRNPLLNITVKFRTADSGATGNVGSQPHVILADEPLPEKVKKELIARNRRENSVLLQVCTALDLKHVWVIEDAKNRMENPDPRFPLYNARAIDNPFFPLSKLEMWKHQYGEDSVDYRVRALGSLETLNGMVFPDIDKCIIPDDWIVDETEGKARHVQADDYGTSDPFLSIFGKVYESGLKVIEDEIHMVNVKDPDEWATAIHKKRDEWDIPMYKLDYYTNNTTVDVKANCIVRRPDYYVGDGAYLQRTFKGPTLKSIFSSRKLYPTPSAKQSLEVMLPVILGEMAAGRLKIRQRCKYMIKYLKHHLMKVNDSGKVSYESPYDHAADVLNYMYQAIPGSSVHYYNEREENKTYGNTNFLNLQTHKRKLSF